ncbi:MAG: arylsulfatase [Verrucomicrobiales bacterium]|nr:arylsulfatase [Verrucomicrobiales bacterium]
MRVEILSLLFLSLWLQSTKADPGTSAPPNIILIMADDMGWSDIGSFGGEIATPNLDRLASEGKRFTQFYNNGKCTTTRASLLTGLYPRNGGKGIELLTDNMVTLGEALKDAGYATGLSGKWHNGSKAPHRPFDRGFQSSYGLWDGCCNFFDPSMQDPPFKGSRVRFFGQNDQRITDFPENYFTTEAFTDHAVATIRRHVENGTPFFHYIAHTAPHYPLHATPEDIAKFEGRYAAGWDELRKARYERQVEMGLIDPDKFPNPGPNPNNRSWESIPEEERAWEARRMEVYAAMVYRMDAEVGRVLDLLDGLKAAENTLVIFLSDNGACPEEPGGRLTDQLFGPSEFYGHVGPDWAYAQNTPLRLYKSTSHEGGIATPLLARWPNAIEAGTSTDAVGHIIDFMPTFLELAGGAYPLSRKGLPIIQEEGVSLASVLKSENTEFERPAPLFWHWAGSRAIREGDWKLVWEKGGEKGWELYQLGADRTETVNRAEGQRGLVQRMAKKWEAWATLTGIKY